MTKILLFYILFGASVVFAQQHEFVADTTSTSHPTTPPVTKEEEETNEGIPVQIECMGGSNKLLFQSIFIKPLDKQNRLNYFLFNYFDRYHNANDQVLNEGLIQSYAAYEVLRGFSAGAGVTYHSVAGLSPNIMLQYVLAGDNYLVVLFPTYYLDQSKAGELFTQLQYRPKINDRWSVFTQLMGVSNWGRFEHHNRSWQQIRLGVEYNHWQFGPAIGFDQYGSGSTAITRSTFGVFIRREFYH